jgi:hypothetical protein
LEAAFSILKFIFPHWHPGHNVSEKGDVFTQSYVHHFMLALLAFSGMNYNVQQVKFIEKVGEFELN